MYFEIAVKDVRKGRDFYAKIIDCDIPFDKSEEYAMIPCGEGGIEGGIFRAKDGEFHPGVTIYVKVDDLQETLNRAVELGGTAGIGDHGHIAVFKDLDGNRIGLWNVE